MTTTDVEGHHPGTGVVAHAFELWLSPIAQPLEVALRTQDKPLGQLTPTEAVAWGTVLAYGGLTGFIVGKMAANMLSVLLGRR